MISCLFVSDIHGRVNLYEKLFNVIENEKPELVFIGGDILPSGTLLFSRSDNDYDDFVHDYLIPRFEKLKAILGNEYPKIFLILGNDDSRMEESAILEAEAKNIWYYANMKTFTHDAFTIIGYSFVPPTPFQLKDWEKYDVSRYVDPGCVSPEEGRRTVEVENLKIKFGTIKNDLEELTKDTSFDKLVCLFHSPPYKTKLDRAALDGKMIDHVPLDVHVGSIAIKKMIEQKQPWLTMHGHVHESTRLTGDWKEMIGGTTSFNAAHDGAELCVIKFDLEDPSTAERILY